MAELVDLRDKIKRYYTFTPSEIKGIVISVLAIAFIISFADWGKGNEVNLTLGMLNFFNAALIAALSLLIHVSAQRIWSLATGFRLEWKMWGFGLLLGLIFAFLTNGKFWLILPGGIILHHLAGHRLGWFRYDINYWAVGIIALAGPLATIALAIISKAFTGVITTPLIQKFIIFNIIYAIYSMIPIPPLDGSRIFYGSRMLYAFFASGIVATAALLTLNINVWLAVLASFFIGIILWILYYIFFEHKSWFAG